MGEGRLDRAGEVCLEVCRGDEPCVGTRPRVSILALSSIFFSTRSSSSLSSSSSSSSASPSSSSLSSEGVRRLTGSSLKWKAGGSTVSWLDEELEGPAVGLEGSEATPCLGGEGGRVDGGGGCDEDENDRSGVGDGRGGKDEGSIRFTGVEGATAVRPEEAGTGFAGKAIDIAARGVSLLRRSAGGDGTASRGGEGMRYRLGVGGEGGAAELGGGGGGLEGLGGGGGTLSGGGGRACPFSFLSDLTWRAEFVWSICGGRGLAVPLGSLLDEGSEIDMRGRSIFIDSVDLNSLVFSSSSSRTDDLLLLFSGDERLFTGEGLRDDSSEYLLLAALVLDGPGRSSGVGGGGVGGLESVGEGGRRMSPRRNTDGPLRLDSAAGPAGTTGEDAAEDDEATPLLL